MRKAYFPAVFGGFGLAVWALVSWTVSGLFYDILLNWLEVSLALPRAKVMAWAAAYAIPTGLVALLLWIVYRLGYAHAKERAEQ
jgi:hypothetical protein